MASELGILGLYGLWVIVTILVQVLTAQAQVGLEMLVKPRDDIPPLTGVAGRMERAQLNSVVALALFAPAVLMLDAKGLTSGGTLLAAQAFLVARLFMCRSMRLGGLGCGRWSGWSVSLLPHGFTWRVSAAGRRGEPRPPPVWTTPALPDGA